VSPPPSLKKQSETRNEGDKKDERGQAKEYDGVPVCVHSQVDVEARSLQRYILCISSSHSSKESQQPQQDAEEEQYHKYEGPKNQVEWSLLWTSQTYLTKNLIFDCVDTGVPPVIRTCLPYAALASRILPSSKSAGLL
jgi:hypothetical protein